MTSSKTIHNDLTLLQNLVFEKCNLKYSDPLLEAESSEYGACIFDINHLSVHFRVSKITPTKTGQFVTLWKRSKLGPIRPFDISELVDLFIVSSRQGTFFGHFVFSKSALCEQGIISNKGKEGKRAMRVYPPWNKALNRQAQKTQEWQLRYFIDLTNAKSIDLSFAKALYGKSKA